MGDITSSHDLPTNISREGDRVGKDSNIVQKEANSTFCIEFSSRIQYCLTMLHSEKPKLYTVLACLSAKQLKEVVH